MSEFNFACSKCPRTFKLSEFYEKHKKVHELKKQHVCNICGFVYGAAKGLEGHLKTHVADSPPDPSKGGSSPPSSNPSTPNANAEAPVVQHGSGNYRVYGSVPDISDGAYQNGIGYYVCELCSREFSGLNSLKKHMPIHGRPIQHKCDICGFVYGKKEYLTEHSKLHMGTIACEVCGQLFNKPNKLKEHLKCHKNTSSIDGSRNEAMPYKCHMCQDVYGEASQLKVHLESCQGSPHNGPPPDVGHKSVEKCVWCPLCSQGFTRHYNLKMHLYKIHGKETVENNFSPEELASLLSSSSFRGKDSPVKGGSLHYFDEVKGTQMLSCNLCSEAFVRKNDLWIHLENSHGSVLLVCRVCEDKFTDLSELKEHIDLSHGRRKPGPASRTNPHPLNRNDSCQCPTCGLILPERLSLSAHIKIVHSSSSESSVGGRHCELCQKDFKSPQDLEAHQKGKHPNLNKRLQNLRDALFPEPKKMKLQEDVEGNAVVLSMSPVSSLVTPTTPTATINDDPSSKHQQPRGSPACPVCGVVLSPKTNINVHLRTHSGDRPYTCVLCLNKFRQKAHLMKHFRCAHHQKMPPFVCQFCGCESFESSNDLYRHITDAHKTETDSIALSNSQATTTEQQNTERSEGQEEDGLGSTPPNPALKEESDSREEEDFEDDDDVQYVPIMEDFYFEDMIIHPCYAVIPFVSDEEIEAACSLSQQHSSFDELDEDQGRLTIDEGSYEENNASHESFKNQHINTTPFTGEHESFNMHGSYIADDIKSDSPPHMGFYPDNISDYSLPFTLSGLWKKKADILGPNAMKQADLLEKQIKKINDYEKRQAEKRYKRDSTDTLDEMVRGSPLSNLFKRELTPERPTDNNNYVSKRKDLKYIRNETPKPVADIELEESLSDEMKFDDPQPIYSGGSPGKGHRLKSSSPHKAPDANVSKYEVQIQQNRWPVECIKCDLKLNDLQCFNIHMNDHWTGDKRCPVCRLLINSKRFNFKQHLKIHTGEKPFVCDICKRSFRQKAHMVKHVTTHRSLSSSQMKLELPAGL